VKRILALAILLIAISMYVCAQQTLPDLFRNASKGKRVKLPGELVPILSKLAACGDSSNGWDVPDVRAIDLNGDGVPEIAVEGGVCFSGANNSDFFVFQKKLEKYEMILEDSVIVFGFPWTRTNGYRDIVTDHHMSAGVYDRTVFKYDGHHYKEAQCTIAAKRCTYRRLGDERWLNNWQITPDKCDSLDTVIPPLCITQKPTQK